MIAPGLPLRWSARLGAALGVLVLALTAAALAAQRASLPKLDGELPAPGLAGAATIGRDALGIAVIRAADQTDAAYALGFAHAQDRFFQMDLARRYAAGTLAEILGPALVSTDTGRRPSLLAHAADALVRDAPPAHRALLDAYSAGVNAGVASLTVSPWEYLLLRAERRPWTPADSALVALYMADSLEMARGIERPRGVMADTLPADLYAFLTPAASRSDATIVPEPAPPEPPPFPSSASVAVAHAARGAGDADTDGREPPTPGSNAWAVNASRTGDGRAILANDMHLGFSVPNVWYRAQLHYTDADGVELRVVGHSLPGVPGIVAGSNGFVAWGFTNLTGDSADWVVVETLPDNPDRYRTPEGDEPFTTLSETIGVNGGDDRIIEVRTTRWGPVVAEDHRGRPLALAWPALQPRRFNLDLFDMPAARTLDEALRVAAAWYGPSQNVLIADNRGRIGWTVSGWLPDRLGHDGTVPTAWTSPGIGWADQSLQHPERPASTDPAAGFIASANARPVPYPASRSLGDHYAHPARQRRITDQLRAATDITERDMLALQLDTRTTYYDLARDLIVAAAERTPRSAPNHADLARAADAARRWEGHADADAVGLILIRAVWSRLRAALLDPLVAPCLDADPGFRYRWKLADEPLRRILEERPPHLLPPEFDSYDALIAGRIVDALGAVDDRYADGAEARWSERTQSVFQHPIARAIGGASFLQMHAADPNGSARAIRVIEPYWGVSQRLVVSPGREEDALCHQPTGQSGHPLSPFYRAGHDDWRFGRPSPLLAGPINHTLNLVPTTTTNAP